MTVGDRKLEELISYAIKRSHGTPAEPWTETARVVADAIVALSLERSGPIALEPVHLTISTDGPHTIHGARLWLARQLLDSTLSEEEVVSVVACHPLLKDWSRP